MELLIGKEISNKIREELKGNLSKLDRKLKLVCLVNKEDASSIGYSRSQGKLASTLGIDYELIEMEPSKEAYEKEIKRINEDCLIDGCLITRPLFKGANEEEIISLLDPLKDVDGMNALSLGELFINKEEAIKPATPRAILELLKGYNIEIKGKDILVVGRSISVGKPVAIMLLNEHATVTIAHTRTLDLDAKLSRADIVVAAVGRPHIIDSSKCKEGAIVIDAGIHYLEDGIVGDVLPNEKLKAISKVPGGVGILTSTLIMDNVYRCYLRRNK
ncbi:MAG: bifunctional 5,10-methylenetetrahydrofolate dehydrogenase/5,10-methenyltetrahydrofolate cyclohydrolase [Erysipelotrichaceae bacterium]|nr:bifunctional 5,10-methylenetetrahydrofolate dehydrogenase/5,10-methenyltetrahydrofolate cyclohydrolase [Erysipelotrichaceae bacterium]